MMVCLYSPMTRKEVSFAIRDFGILEIWDHGHLVCLVLSHLISFRSSDYLSRSSPFFCLSPFTTFCITPRCLILLSRLEIETFFRCVDGEACTLGALQPPIEGYTTNLKFKGLSVPKISLDECGMEGEL